MKACELIYTYRYKDEEDNLLSGCFKELRRYTKHNKNKDH
jgi:hypothetical protein